MMQSVTFSASGAVSATGVGDRRWWWRTAALLAAVILVGHGQALWGGFAFDDHLHRRALQEAGWSAGELARAGRVGQTGGLVEYWWAEAPSFWQPFRPLAFALMKLQYAACGWRAAGMHAFGLAWHWGAALLVAAIGLRVLGSGASARLGAVLFALHPGHATTAAWIACQNEVMGTFFILGAVAAYGRFAEWGEGRGGAAGRPSRLGAAALTLACTGAALLCRETGVVVPLLIVWLDLLLGKGPWRRRAMMLAALAAVCAVYLFLRARVLEGMPLPGPEYLQRPGEAGFTRYVFDKLLFYYLGLYAYVPSLQLGVFEWFRAHPAALYGLAAAVGGAVLWAIRTTAGLTRAAWALLGWSAIAVGPVLPVFAGSHHLYLASAGACLLMAAMLVQLPERAGDPARRRRRRAAGAVLALLYGAGTVFSVWQFQRVVRVEARWCRALAAACGAANPGDVLYIIDFPPLASFVPPGVAEAVGVRDLAVCALTVRPSGQAPTSIERLDERTLRLRRPRAESDGHSGKPHLESAAQAGAFARMAERQIITLIPAAAGRGALDTAGASRRGPGFTAIDLGAQPDGTQVLELRFDEPFTSPRNHFCIAEAPGSVRKVDLYPLSGAARGAGA